MLAVTLLLISLTAALPGVYTEAQREKEEELIFRGNQYARAIIMYRARFGRFPASVDDLVKKTNGYRFLRQAFKDPMTKKGNWRFIHADARGVIVDSLTLPLAPRPGGNGLNSSTGFNLGAQTPGAGSNFQTQRVGAPWETTGNSESGSQSSSSNEVQGGFVVGVASTSHKSSIRVWNNKTHYNEWEFLGVPQAAGGVTIGLPGPQTAPGQNGGPGFGGGWPQPPNGPRPVGPSNPQ